MKKVFSSNSDCIHMFAQRSQDEGRSSSVFFRDDKIYSYGYHYLLGQFHEIKNDVILIINNKGYSVSTAKHINMLSQATRQYKTYYTKDIDIKLVRDQIINLYDRLLRAKKPYLYSNPIIDLWNRFLDSPFEISIEDVYYIEALEIFNKITQNHIEGDREKYKQDQKNIKIKKAIELKKLVLAFKIYEIDYLRASEDFLRISKDGQNVETSQRVKIPIEDAKILYRLIKLGKDVKGHRIANYTVISINGHLKIGCHNINIEDVKNIGEEILTN